MHVQDENMQFNKEFIDLCLRYSHTKKQAAIESDFIILTWNTIVGSA